MGVQKDCAQNALPIYSGSLFRPKGWKSMHVHQRVCGGALNKYLTILKVQVHEIINKILKNSRAGS